MKKLLFYPLIILFLFIFNLSCNKTNDVVPYTPVDIYISLSNPEFYALNAIGNYIAITGGYKGIILYRKGNNEFIAFERACTYDPECSRLEIDEERYLLTHHDCCGSEFSILLDGAIVTSPASLPVKQYHVTFYPNNNSLHITNY